MQSAGLHTVVVSVTTTDDLRIFALDIALAKHASESP